MSVVWMEFVNKAKNKLFTCCDWLVCKWDLIVCLDDNKFYSGYINSDHIKEPYIIWWTWYTDVIRKFREFFEVNILTSDWISDLFDKFYQYCKQYNHLDEWYINSNFIIYWHNAIYKYEDWTLEVCSDRAIIWNPTLIYTNNDKTLEEIVEIHKKNMTTCWWETKTYTYKLH